MSHTSHHYITDYLADRVARDELAPSSTQAIRWTLHRWIEHAGPDPAAWTEDQTLAWVHDSTLRPASRKSRLGRLRPWLRWLVDEGVIARDLTSRAGRIRVSEGEPRDLTPDEIAAVIAAAGDDHRAATIVLLMAHCGLRCGDVARVRIEDIDLRRRLLHVRAKGGRGEPTHWCPIPTQAWEAIQRWMRIRPGTPGRGALITAMPPPHGPITPAHVGVIVRRLIDAAGLKGWAWDGRSAHSLRHSCAQHMIDGGADLRLVQHALGHRTMRTTEIYVRREPPGLREAMEGRDYLRAA